MSDNLISQITNSPTNLPTNSPTNSSTNSPTNLSTNLSNPPAKNNFNKIIKQYVQLLKIKMSSDDMIFLKKYHPTEYESQLSEYVPAFKDEYPHLFKMIISGADLNMLDVFLNNMTKIENGDKTLNEARNEMGEILHEKYVKNNIKK